MRIPSPIPLRGWTADAAYDQVPPGMSLDIQNMVPNDQWQGRLRLGTRPGITPIDMFAAGDGTDYGNNGAGEIQCIVSCSNYVGEVRHDRLLLVINGYLWQKLSGSAATRISTAYDFIHTGQVSGVQFKDYVYFCDGTNYKKVALATTTAVISDWIDGTDGPVQVANGTNKANLIVKFGARLAMAGVVGAKETWFMCAVDDPDDWNPDTGTAVDAIAGGTSSALGYGTMGEPIEALIPFGRSGLLMCGRNTISNLTNDPAFDGTIQMMSRSLGLVSPSAWCPGPGQSVFVLSSEGMLLLDPNVFAVDKSNIISRGRLDSFFGNRSWVDTTATLVHDVQRTGVWIFLNDSDSPSDSQHLFYSYATDGFFPIKFVHPRFTGATVGIHASISSGEGESGQSIPLFGSADGMLATFDSSVICGSDGHKSSFTSGNSYTDATLTALDPLVAPLQRVESWVSIGPLAAPEPTNILIREVTVESGLDEYIPDTATKGATSSPRVELVYGESPQEAIGSAVAGVYVARADEVILDCGYWDAPDSVEVTLDGGTQDGAGAYATATFTFADDQETPSGQQTITLIDTAGTSRAYVIDNDYGANDPLEFNAGQTGTVAAANFKTVVESSAGHNGTIFVSVVAGAVTLKQAAGGTDGNRTIAHSGGWDALCSVNPPSAFTGGAAGPLDYCESNADGDVLGAASDDTAIDGGYSVRPWTQQRWIANDLFAKPSGRTYEPISDNGWYLKREAWPTSTDSDRWVFRAPMGGKHYDGLTDTGVSTPVSYVQQADSAGLFPVSLLGQEFHGYGRFYITPVGATATFTLGDTEYAATNNETITLVDTAGTPRTYVCKNDYGASGALEWNAGGSATASAANFKAVVEASTGHNGTITVSVVAGAVTMTQVVTGSGGNTNIEHSSGWDALCDVNVAATFTGGTSSSTQAINGVAGSGHPAAGDGEFGTFDSNPASGTQWDGVTETWAEHDGFFKADILTTQATTFQEVSLLDLGCLTIGRGNRRRCRVRAQAAFVRVRGVKDGGQNTYADETSGHPFVLEGVTVEAEAVGPRRKVETPVCDGTYTGTIIPDEPDDTETEIGACCTAGNCTEVLESECSGIWLGPISEGTPRCADTECSEISTAPCCYLALGGILDWRCEIYTETRCLSKHNPTWHPEFTACSQVTDCILDWCCADCFALENTTEEECQELQGIWDPPELPCCVPEPHGACCECGTCTDVISESECPTGTFYPDTFCVDVVCRGACIYTNDSCADTCAFTTHSACAASGGVFFAGRSCTGEEGCPTVEGKGYCCVDGGCDGKLYTSSECTQSIPQGQGGVFVGIPCCGDGTVIGCGGVRSCPGCDLPMIYPCKYEPQDGCDCCGPDE